MTDAQYRKPGRLVESDDPAIIAFARDVTAGAQDEAATAVRLFEAVRDQIVYDPYMDLSVPESYSASATLARRRGFCIAKAALLAACARAIGIPARIGFADVRNHLASPRIVKANGGDTFRWHAYTELLLGDAWVKATPTFDRALCQRCGIEPLAFDGRTNAMMHPYDRKGQKHMEYVQDRGVHAEVPLEAVMATLRAESPGLFEQSWLAGAKPFVAEVQAAE